ncbi:uncharacterized protein LOC136026243 isoform X2 [Artemia franciscana]|uniref:Major facilitator superfamily associated domain-containing protein n=1 Tax=Artemia franciscana TaxID=6661 RepID=A0AA88KXI4_ARTSF|nr:hypothetical protein QYM36_012424 [Artemia franciscana]
MTNLVSVSAGSNGVGAIQRIRNLLKFNPNLVLLKLALFLHYGGVSAIFPYYTVHMKSIGLSIEEISTISTCLPFVSLICSPIAGMISDKLGQYRYVLIGTLIAAVISQTCILLADARIPDGFEAYNASAILYSINNETQIQITSDTWNTSSPLLAMRFVIPPSETQHCVREETFITFIPKEKEGLIATGDVDLDITECITPVEIEIIGLRLEDESRDAEYQASHIRGFWIYFLVRGVSTAMLASTFCSFDAITLAMVKEHNGDYGKQRFFSMFGLSTVSPFVGILADWLGSLKGYRDYSSIFLVGHTFWLVAALLVWKLDVKADKPEGSFLTNLQQLLTIPEIPIFLVFMLFLGTNFGFMDNYLFIFLVDDIKTPNFLLGLSVTVGCIFGLPFLCFSNKIIKEVGIVTIIVVAFWSYAVRYIGFSLMTNPWNTLVLECLKFLSYHMLHSAACKFCSIKAPKGLLATLTAVYCSTHYQLGRSSGAFVGGILISRFGTRETFKILAYAALLFGTCYWLTDVLVLKRIESKRIQRMKETEEESKTPFFSNS